MFSLSRQANSIRHSSKPCTIGYHSDATSSTDHRLPEATRPPHGPLRSNSEEPSTADDAQRFWSFHSSQLTSHPPKRVKMNDCSVKTEATSPKRAPSHRCSQNNSIIARSLHEQSHMRQGQQHLRSISVTAAESQSFPKKNQKFNF